MTKRQEKILRSWGYSKKEIKLIKEMRIEHFYL